MLVAEEYLTHKINYLNKRIFYRILMTKTCPKCGKTNIPDDAAFCTNPDCDHRFKKASGFTKTSESGQRTVTGMTLVMVVLYVIAFAFMFFPGGGLISLPIAIGAGYLAATRGEGLIKDIMPRITIIIIAVTVRFITILPGYELVSLFGFAIGWMSIILTLPEKAPKTEGERKTNLFASGPVIAWGVVALITTFLWTLYLGMELSNDLTFIVTIEAFTIGLVAASIVWKQPVKPGLKLILTLVCFAPLIFVGVNFLFVAGGAFLGGVMDQISHALSGTGEMLSGTGLDFLLNPKLAVQSGLKPATTREVTETAGPASVRFQVTGDSIPDEGCYDTSTFQIIGRVKNTGDEFISDLKINMEVDDSPDLDFASDPCEQLEFSQEACGDREWNVNSLPEGVTTSKTCIVTSVPEPGTAAGAMSEIPGVGELFEGSDVAPTHACFIDIIAETGFHSMTRLPIEFIESAYGRSKFEQKQLTMNEVRSTTSIGPVELSLGGFEDPVLFYGADQQEDTTVTMITTVTESGNGEVVNYLSAYMYIPNILLEPVAGVTGVYQCYSSGDNWNCMNRNPKAMSGTARLYPAAENYCQTGADNQGFTIDSREYQYCLKYYEYVWDESIGGYDQFSYDNSHELLLQDHSICFYKNELSTDNLISTGTCTLLVNDNLMDVSEQIDDLRKTILIRGDVIYTYKVEGEASFTVRDCTLADDD